MSGSILVPVDGLASGRPALDTALALSARFDWALTGLGLIPPLTLPHFIDEAAAAAISATYDGAVDAQLDRIARIFSDAVQAAELTARAEWLVIEGPPTAVLAEQARYAGMVVVARPGGADEAYPLRPQLETVILDGGRPLLLVPPQGPAIMPGRRVVIGWNNSRESARAVADALPFLEQAEAVQIITLARTDASHGNPAAELAMALARRGITAEPLLIDVASAPDPAAALLAHADSFKADLIVAGARAAPSWQDIVIGRTTRRLLDSAPVPLLLST